MGVSWISHLAAEAPVPVFVAIGENVPAHAARLALDPGLSLVDTPRAATILLVAGTIPDALTPHLHRLHDQLAHPRASVLWQAATPGALPAAVTVAETDDIVAVLTRTRNALLSGTLQSEPDLLPDTPPNEWRGIGPHGQGGKGMMGGTPYGRPMAMTADDIRDGLTLDVYTADFGPFLPMFPPGLVLTLTLQGDVIQKAAAVHPPFGGNRSGGVALLRLLGLPALAERLLGDGPKASATLTRLIRWSGASAAIPPGLGRTHDGSDVRDRFDRLIADPANPTVQHIEGAKLNDLLVGLEWHEAMLVLNSFDTATLQQICANDADEGDEPDTKTTHASHVGHGS